MQFLKRYKILSISIFATLISLSIGLAVAVNCPALPKGGDYTVTSSCSFANTVDGIDNGKLTINSGSTLTINADQTIVFNNGKSIIPNGSLVVNGEVKKTNLWMRDADNDGYPANTAQTASDNPGAGYKRRYQMTSMTQTDCNDTNVSFFQNCPPPSTSTSSATSVTSSSATLNGSANPDGIDTTGWFMVSLTNGTCTDSFGVKTPSNGIPIGSGQGNSNFNVSPSLDSNTTYYFCAVASNVNGKGFGTVLAFKTPPPSFNLTVNSGCCSGSYVAGSTVNISANATPQWQAFDRWTGQAVASPTSSNTSLTMPFNNASVTATYYTPTYDLFVNSGSGDGTYSGGTTVNISANSPQSWQHFSQWTGYAVANSGSSSTTLTMPANSVSATANYADNWTFCANEGGTCSFNGSRWVMYYADGSHYIQKYFNSSTPCTNAVFTDPWPGHTKWCYYWWQSP